MKLSIAIFNAIVIMASMTSPTQARMSLVAIAEDADAHPFGVCEADEVLIETALGQVLAKLEEEDDDIHGDDRQLGHHHIGNFCWNYCRGFKAGDCHRVNPWCWPYRRQRNLKQVKFDDKPLAPMIENDGRYHGNNEVGEIPESQREVRGLKCAQAIIAVEARLEELAWSVSTDECKSSLLDSNRSYSCYEDVQ